MNEKEKLEQEKDKLKNQLFKVEKELNDLFISENKPLFDKKYTDTYWKFKNRYSNEKGWTVYVHAKKVTKFWNTGVNGVNCYISCDTFEITNDNKLNIAFDHEHYYFMLTTKITKEEFDNAVSKMIRKAKEAIS